MPPIADVRLTIAPARGLEWIRLSSTVRRLGLGLGVVVVVGGIGLLLVPDQVFPRLLGLLGVAVLITVIVTAVRANSSGRVRVEVGRKELAVIGIRTPLVVPIRDVGSACIVSRFRQGLGFSDPVPALNSRRTDNRAEDSRIRIHQIDFEVLIKSPESSGRRRTTGRAR